MEEIRAKTFQEIVDKYLKGKYDPPVKIGYKAEQLPIETVIDEDKSVRWNREEVTRINGEKRIEFEKMKSMKKFLAAQYRSDLAAAALNECGKRFEQGTLYLPQLLMSAEAAKAAFDTAKAAMPEATASKGKVILATVKGDIHDIGKNIVRVILESYGFSVLDLGRDVAPEEVLCAARESNVSCIGLSALMTTTVPAMRETVALLHRELPDVKICVGGAVLTEDYARDIGADAYCPDAMAGVRFAEQYAK